MPKRLSDHPHCLIQYLSRIIVSSIHQYYLFEVSILMQSFSPLIFNVLSCDQVGGWSKVGGRKVGGIKAGGIDVGGIKSGGIEAGNIKTGAIQV